MTTAHRTAAPAGTVGMTVRYALMSTRTAYRNLRFLVLTVALPLLLFLLYANLYQGQDAGGGLSVVAYLMVSMASFGCIGAAINTGARVAIERQTGWNRQLRLTALPASSYLIAKAVGVHAGHPARADPGLHRRRDDRRRHRSAPASGWTPGWPSGWG